jgi:hypothetical protein
MVEYHGALRREIDSPPGAVFIEQPAGRLWVTDRRHGSAPLEACGSETAPGQ